MPFSRATLVMGKESEVFHPRIIHETVTMLCQSVSVYAILILQQDASPPQDMPHSRLIRPMGSFDCAIVIALSISSTHLDT